MGEIRGIEPNKPLLSVSQYLRKPRDFLNKGFISDPFGEEDWRLGFGDLLFGEAPEVLEDAAYGWMPTEGSGQTLRLKPEVVDVAALPTFGAGAGARATIRALRKPRHGTLSKALVPTEETIEEAPDLSRRKFLKDMGKVAAVTAAAGVTAKSLLPDLLRKGVPEEDVAKMAAKTAARSIDAKKSLVDFYSPYFDKIIKNELNPGNDARYYVEDAKALKEAMIKDPQLLVGDIEDFQKFLEDLPEDITPEMVLQRGMAGVDAPLGSGPDPRMRSDEVYNLPDRRTSEDFKKFKEAEAIIRANRGTGIDIDRWIVTGEPPEWFPEEYLKYVHPEHVRDQGMFFGNMTGSSIMDPYSLIDLHKEGSLYGINYKEY